MAQTIFNDNYLIGLNRNFGSTVLSSTKFSYFRDDEAQQFNTALQQTPTLFLYNVNFGSVVLHGQPVQLPGFFDFNVATGRTSVWRPAEHVSSSTKICPGHAAGIT